MKILVCISKAPDTTTKIAFRDNNSAFDETNVTWIVNPYDEWYALVRALEIKEANPSATSVTIISVGAPDMEAVIRKALAIGADEAIRIDAEPGDTFFAAAQIADYAKQNQFDLVFAGKETISFNGSSFGGMLAELLNLPFISMATKFELNGSVARIEQEVDGGTQVVECELPLVLSAAKGLAEARIPNMRGIMAARTKPLTVVPAQSAHHALTSINVYNLAQGRTTCKMIPADQVDELINLLHNEAKAI